MDDLERRIRAARPVSRSRDLPLSDRAKRELADLLLADNQVEPPKPRRGRGWLHAPRMLAMAAAAIVALGVGLFWPTASPQASAATPAMMAIDPLGGDGSALAMLEAAAAGQSTPADPVSGEVVITMQSWVLSIEAVDGDIPASNTVISPQVSTLTLFPDGSMSKVMTAGDAYDHSGVPVSKQSPPPGTVLGRLDQSTDEYVPLYSAPAPRDARLVEDFLRVGSGLEVAQASNAFLAISYLLQEQRLDGYQTAAVIAFLSDLPDYKVEGTTQDRLDRDALVLSAQRAGDQYADYLLLDREDGHVLAFESVYVGDTRTDLTAPAVTEYHLWEND